MSDKVNKEESIARVYQFLNTHKDWKTKADSNNDGTIVKTEFHKYLIDNFKFNNGDNKEDLIDAFWKSIDCNTKGKIKSGSAINNKNALDANELVNVEKTVEATKKVVAFIQDKKAPEELQSYESSWKISVKQGLINRASEYIKSGGEVTDEWLESAYQASSAKATADYYATSQIESETNLLVKSEDGKNNTDYKVADDQTFKGIVDEYISQMGDNPKDEATIISEIKQLVAAYVDTAKTNSAESVNLLAQYGYDSTDYMNDLQIAVLTKDITDKVLEYVKANNADIYTDEYKEQVEAAVKQFVVGYLEDKSASEFSSLKDFDPAVFAKSDEYKTLIDDIKQKQKELKDAQDSLYQHVLDILNEKENSEAGTRAVVNAVGASDTEAIKNTIYGLKTIDAVNKMRADIDKELADELEKIAAEVAAKKAEYQASFGKLASSVEQIKDDNLRTMTMGKSTIHTEFGMDESGNIVFEQNETTQVYEEVVKTLTAELRIKNKEAFEAIGESNIKKLIQASWIASYNRFASAQSNATAAFITEVCNQFEKILNKLSENPEYLTAYVGRGAYANSKLTSDVMYYGTNDTYGNDAIWDYSGFTSISSNGSVNWDSAEDAPEYDLAMEKLLKNILKSSAYKDIDESLITSVFREAQEEAIKACVNNKNDCPYGTTTAVDRGFFPTMWSYSQGIGTNPSSPIATAGTDWSGLSREGDRSRISPKALIEMTLYYFDKLLYSRLTE